MDHHPSAQLTDEQQLKAQRKIRGFFWLNGIAVTCVMENILLLWALRNGLSAPWVAVLSSFMFLAMPFMIMGRRLSSTLGLVRAKSTCWFIRYLFVLAMVPLPWLHGTAWAPAIPWIITACVFGLFVFRSMGMINTLPLMGAAAGQQRLGSFQASVSMRAHTSYFVMLIVVMRLLAWRDSLGTYQVVLTIGSLVGFLSVAVLRGTPEPPALRDGARLRISELLREVRCKKSFRRLALAWCAATTATALIAPIAMLALKRGYGVADDAALGFTLIELAGAFLAAATLTVIADHTGPRPIILMGMLLFVGAAGFWAFAPLRFLPVAAGGAFLMTGLAKGGLNLALSHYLLATSSHRERLGIGLLMQMLSGAASGVAGAFIGGGLLRLLMPYAGEGLPLYHAYYRVVLVIAVLLTINAVRLPRLKDWAVRNVIGLIFSFNNLRTLITLNRLRRDASDDEDAENLKQLTALASRHSEPVLREFLETGRLVPQAHAIQALGRIRFGDATARALIRLVREGAFTNGWRAAELLGQRRIAAAIPALREGLASADPFLCGKCMAALARLRDTPSYAAIRARFKTSDNPRILIQGAEALEAIRAPGDLRLLLAKSVERDWPQPVLDEVLMAIAALCGRKRQVYLHLRSFTAGDDLDGGPPRPRSRTGGDTPAQGEVHAFLAVHDWNKLPPRMRCALYWILTDTP